MSSINGHIAASASQAALQQSQVAKSLDATRREQQLKSQQLKELLNKHMESVEDSTEADTDKMRISDEDREQQNKRRKRQQQDNSEQNQAFKNIDGQTHIDIEA